MAGLGKRFWIRVSDEQYSYLKKHFKNRSEVIRSFINWSMSAQRESPPSDYNIINTGNASSHDRAEKDPKIEWLFSDLPH